MSDNNDNQKKGESLTDDTPCYRVTLLMSYFPLVKTVFCTPGKPYCYCLIIHYEKHVHALKCAFSQ